jgi:hypothetical protein
VKDDVVVVSALCELSKVFAGLWRMFFVEFDGNQALGDIRCALLNSQVEKYVTREVSNATSVVIVKL